MWLGTEDGFIHIYYSSDNIRVKKNKIKMQLNSPVNCIAHVENKVFAGLSSGQLVVFKKSEDRRSWMTSDPMLFDLSCSPVVKLLPVGSRLWCGSQNLIQVVDPETLEVETSFPVSEDASRVVTCMAFSGLGVWIAIQGSPVVRLFHSISYELLLEVNVSSSVSKMLTSKYCILVIILSHPYMYGVK